MTPEPYPQHAPVPLWRDVRVLRVAGQIVVLLGVGLFVAFLARNFLTAIDQRGLGFGFGFLGRTAGFEIAESPIPYSATDTYGAAFLAGLLNTLFVSVVGIVLATFLGIVVGVARLSNNWLVRQIASGYVEIMRNTPLLVQLLLIYFAVLLRLPPISDTIELPGSVYLNQRGVFIPSPVVEPGLPILIGFVIAGIVVAVILRRLSRQRRDDGLPTYRLGLVGLAAFALLAVAGWLIGETPLSFDEPVRERFNFVGGMGLSPEFTALLVGLVIYTAAFIGEVVRGGIQAVRRGQVEAARALGLSEGETLKLIVFPQALRIIVPPLTSQYLNLAKNSSLAIAIGYPDLFKVGVTMSNQTGQPVPVVILIMGTYLSISLVTSLLMNIYNRRVQVLER
ncbi:MAG TPA: ABC transporter permease subunit [Candidatus Limnocylindrales bacterium]|nr:ABC transporter permease subunit [Candidatus Limnocylindrales bacterium]